MSFTPAALIVSKSFAAAAVPEVTMSLQICSEEEPGALHIVLHPGYMAALQIRMSFPPPSMMTSLGFPLNWVGIRAPIPPEAIETPATATLRNWAAEGKTLASAGCSAGEPRAPVSYESPIISTSVPAFAMHGGFSAGAPPAPDPPMPAPPPPAPAPPALVVPPTLIEPPALVVPP